MTTVRWCKTHQQVVAYRVEPCDYYPDQCETTEVGVVTSMDDLAEIGLILGGEIIENKPTWIRQDNPLPSPGRWLAVRMGDL